MLALLERAEPLNNNPVIHHAVEGKVKDARELLDVILLVETYYKAWNVVANSRFQLLISSISKYRKCQVEFYGRFCITVPCLSRLGF